MPIPKALSPKQLSAKLESGKLPWQNSQEIPVRRKSKKYYDPFQSRAMQALDLALQINSMDYHVYLSADPELDPDQMLKTYLESRKKDKTTPPDLVYVQNFDDPDKPCLLTLPSGFGNRFKNLFLNLIKSIGKGLKNRLESSHFKEEREELQSRYQEIKAHLLAQMSELASHMGFILQIDENGGIAIAPGKEKKQNENNADVEDSIPEKSAHLARRLSGLLKELNNAEIFLVANEKHIEKMAMDEILSDIFTEFEEIVFQFCNSQEMRLFLKNLKSDIEKHSSLFIVNQNNQDNDFQAEMPESEDLLKQRYNINVLVDNSSLKGAPIIFEENPNVLNLLGCLERESEMGALVTNFMLIRAGSLHKANGGYLILHIEELLNHQTAWEGLIRSLNARMAFIEDTNEYVDSTLRTKSLLPDGIPLNLTVILIGNEDIYEILLENDERFSKIFRIKAHMTDTAVRNSSNIRHYLSQIGEIINKEKLLPFNADALAWIVDLSSRLSEDQQKLSLKFSYIKDYMVEASALAKIKNKDCVSEDILEEAQKNKIYRGNLLEEFFLEEYERNLIKITTSGSAIGQINGLTVTCNGDFEFGLPHRISCAIGVGHEGIIDLEREAELGGPIHTKAMLILKSFLTSHFAHKKPIVLTGSLYFEQNYACIEGDSASGAELAAIISALSNIPLRLDLAFTGAVSQTGAIMAVGGVSKKIEGFFKVCKRQGLTGKQGVIIPADNVAHLMLSSEIIRYVKENKFFIYPVNTIHEALFLLTGIKVGKKRKDGTYTPDSLFAFADARLEQLGAASQHSFRNIQKNHK